MDIAAICALLEQHLCQDAAAANGCRCRVAALSGARSYSQVFRANCDGISHTLFVKRCLHPGSGAADIDTARTQFRGLQQAWRRSGRPARYNVPEPLLLVDSQAIVVTEWVQGPSLTQRLRRWNVAATELDRCMVQAAEWLSWYHRGKKISPIQVDCEELIGRLRDGDPVVLRDQRFSQGCELLRHTAARVSRVLTPRAELHGDYKSDNLLIAGERVAAIDIQPDFCNSVLFDIASFLNHLELSAWHPKAWRMALRRRRLVQIFLQRYFETRVPPELVLALAWVRLFNVLGAWLDSAAETSSRLRHRFAYFCYRRLVRSLIRELHVAAREIG